MAPNLNSLCIHFKMMNDLKCKAEKVSKRMLIHLQI
ncbi:unnamed protein product [Cuscuta europaea]|uniref:Uncharacterized protein n=1 Tax=Cuscuta europaea TaxID=41803 RepID=A0A9P0YPF7_CUSEU|nr:unnamed protein product [Cuscuta europaea]